MSGFTVRLATMMCVLAFLYNTQSSAHAWHPTKAPVTNLPVNPNDPFYESKSFFFQAVRRDFHSCLLQLTSRPHHGLLAVFNIAASENPGENPWKTLLVLIYNRFLINQLNYDTVFVSNESQRELFYITVSRMWVQCKFHRMNSVALPFSLFKFTIKLSELLFWSSWFFVLFFFYRVSKSSLHQCHCK